MFGAGSPEWFRKKKEQTANLPEREVSEEEFVKLFMETGATEEKAKFQAKISKALGSSVHVGQEMLKIVDDESHYNPRN